MIDQVILGRGIVGDDFSAVDPIGFRDGPNLGLRSREPEKPAAKMRHVVFQDCRRIAPGINGNEQGLNFAGFVSQDLQRLRHVLQVGRANCRAIGIAEKYHHKAAAELF